MTSADFLPSPKAILAHVEAGFAKVDPAAIASALNVAAQAMGLPQDALTARSDIASVIEAVTALGLKLTLKAA
jgi:DNA-binding phage protein